MSNRYHPYGSQQGSSGSSSQWGHDVWETPPAPWHAPALRTPMHMDVRNVDPTSLQLLALLQSFPAPAASPPPARYAPVAHDAYQQRWPSREPSGRNSASPRLDGDRRAHAYSRERREQQEQQQQPPPRDQKVPRDWEKYSRWHEALTDVQIIPLKCPLSPEYDANLRRMGLRESEFLPLEGFLEAQRALGRRVGLLIDLTDTYRYYDGRRAQERHGLRYEKLRCPGRVAPDERLVARFADLVDGFRSQRPEEWVAVHCTHGVNRTGFMVISYLCARRGLPFPEARARFEAARGETLDDDEEHAYLFDELRARFGAPRLYPRPDGGDGDGSLAGAGHRSRDPRGRGRSPSRPAADVEAGEGERRPERGGPSASPSERDGSETPRGRRAPDDENEAPEPPPRRREGANEPHASNPPRRASSAPIPSVHSHHLPDGRPP
eukprot:tig00001623_g9418.t1